MKPTTCRSCGYPIYWAITETGSKMPVDADPVATGNVTLTLRRSTGELHARVWGRATIFPSSANRYTSHFATCPNADEHRK